MRSLRELLKKSFQQAKVGRARNRMLDGPASKALESPDAPIGLERTDTIFGTSLEKANF